MAKPVGYFSLSHDNTLIKDMCETWGEDLSQMSETDIFWLIGRMCHDLWLTTDTNDPPSDEVEEVVSRLHELKRWERIALIKALMQEA
ncbi:MAG: hypothetical protein MET45_20940 [Nostoc sp. LLA-1]|jgi:hypothetical protein|nr:hypothetical protein [Cyanocohniella sp. LLY]